MPLLSLRENYLNTFTDDVKLRCANLLYNLLADLFVVRLTVVRHFDSTMPKLLSKYMLTLVLLCFAQVGQSQTNKTFYNSYKTTADSIVKLYFGDSLLRYIDFDSTSSYYRTLKIGGGRTFVKFTETLDFEPEMFAFHYYLKHPGFHGDTLSINFYVDRNHRIMEGFLPKGLYDMKGKTSLYIISKDKALEVARKAKIKRPQKNYKIEFGWYEQEATTEDYTKFKQTNDIRQIVKGRIVWKVTSKFRDAPEWDEKPYAQTFIIDAITGEVIAVEQAFIDWG
jgi:hypothetical protein